MTRALTKIDAYTGNGVPAVTDFPGGGGGVLYVDQADSRIYTVIKGAVVLVDVAAATTSNPTHRVASVAQGADASTDIFTALWAGTVTAVKYIPQSTITGADTDYRTVKLVNLGAAGAGTTAVATLDFTSGVSATADIAKTITLSVTGSDLVVAAGDVLQWKSVHAGAGIADPGGLTVVTLSRT